jgi:hypothetical protein
MSYISTLSDDECQGLSRDLLLGGADTTAIVLSVRSLQTLNSLHIPRDLIAMMPGSNVSPGYE